MQNHGHVSQIIRRCRRGMMPNHSPTEDTAGINISCRDRCNQPGFTLAEVFQHVSNNRRWRYQCGLLHHLQVDLIRRYREGKADERVQRGIHISINGIAAGLRNTG